MDGVSLTLAFPVNRVLEQLGAPGKMNAASPAGEVMQAFGLGQRPSVSMYFHGFALVRISCAFRSKDVVAIPKP